MEEVCKGGGAEDIISSLPEGILSHIISFLPLEEAIRTSLLSRKWRYIFTVISNIEIDFDTFLFGRRVRKRKRRFMNLVEGFLGRRIGFVDKVRINNPNCTTHDGPDRVDAWLRYALLNKVKELDLSLEYDYRSPSHLLSHTLFTCNTLEVLRLSLDYDLVLPAHAKVCLPNLKSLRLENYGLANFDIISDLIQRLIRGSSQLEELVLDLHTSCLTRACICNVLLIQPTLKRLKLSTNLGLSKKDNLLAFHSGIVVDTTTTSTICSPPRLLKSLHLLDVKIFDAHSFQTLISSCLALEELVLTNCHLDNSHELNVFNPTLKTLTISCFHFACRQGFGQDYEISIDAPSLVFFNYACCRPFLLKNLNSLIHVRLDFAQCKFCVRSNCDSAPICLFKGIGNTQSLHLSLVRAEDLLLEGNLIIPEFPKLTYLKLDYYTRETALPDLLSKFPLLETLDLKIDLDYPILISKLRQHSFLWSPLKKLEILTVEVEDWEKEIIDYFLENAPALEELTIKISRRSRRRRSRRLKGEEWMSNTIQTVLNLSKISTKCKISVVY